MTETNAPSPAPSAAKMKTTQRRAARAIPWLAGTAAFIVLAGAIAYVGLRPRPSIPPPPNLAPLTRQIANLTHGLQDTRNAFAGVNDRLASIETRLTNVPPANGAIISQLEKRLGALESRVGALAKAAVPSQTAPHAPDTKPPAGPAAPSDAELASMKARLDALEKGLSVLGGSKAEQARLAAGEAAQSKALAALEKVAEKLTRSDTALAARLATLDRLERTSRAGTALKEGRPLGTIPGAPPALSRYASVAPPTLAALRVAFPEAVQAELALAAQGDAGKGFLGQMRARLGRLVSVREGDKVLVGNPASGIIAKAKVTLEAGDLEGTLAALSALQEPLAPAMAAWVEQARNLLAAEAALAALRGAD